MPTLAAVVGVSLLLGGFGSRAWSGVVAALAASYGVFGVLRLGVAMDVVLALGAFVLAGFAITLPRQEPLDVATRYSVRDAFRLPSLVTLARLPLAIAFPWLVERPRWAIALQLLAGASDVLDGFLARRLHEESATGALLDAVMDKVFVIVVVGSLVAAGSLTIVQALLLGTHDIGELPLLARRAVQHRLGVRAPRPNLAGKVATAFQFVTLLAIVGGTGQRAAWVAAASACGVLAAIAYWLQERHADGAALATPGSRRS